MYPVNTKTVTLNFIARNEGPEIAGDVTISFTPPFGTSLLSVSSNLTCTVFPAKGEFADNSFYKCKLGTNDPLLPHNTFFGQIVYNILPIAPQQIHFRVTATTSSIDTVFGNNHLLQLIYINK